MTKGVHGVNMKFADYEQFFMPKELNIKKKIVEEMKKCRNKQK